MWWTWENCSEVCFGWVVLCVSLRKGLCELSGIREKWMELWNKIMKCQMDNMCKETNCKEKIGMVLVY